MRKEASNSLLHSPERNQPADVLISDFQPPGLWDNKFHLFKPPCVWYVVMATPGNEYRQFKKEFLQIGKVLILFKRVSFKKTILLWLLNFSLRDLCCFNTQYWKGKTRWNHFRQNFRVSTLQKFIYVLSAECHGSCSHHNTDGSCTKDDGKFYWMNDYKDLPGKKLCLFNRNLKAVNSTCTPYGRPHSVVNTCVYFIWLLIKQSSEWKLESSQKCFLQITFCQTEIVEADEAARLESACLGTKSKICPW